jgi:hypothetical protein
MQQQLIGKKSILMYLSAAISSLVAAIQLEEGVDKETATMKAASYLREAAEKEGVVIYTEADDLQPTERVLYQHYQKNPEAYRQVQLVFQSIRGEFNEQ